MAPLACYPPWTLAAGTRLGSSAIVSPLAPAAWRGLNCDVAIQVLPERLGADPELLARLRSIGSLATGRATSKHTAGNLVHYATAQTDLFLVTGLK